jgi:hypothetical protein
MEQSPFQMQAGSQPGIQNKMQPQHSQCGTPSVDQMEDQCKKNPQISDEELTADEKHGKDQLMRWFPKFSWPEKHQRPTKIGV